MYGSTDMNALRTRTCPWSSAGRSTVAVAKFSSVGHPCGRDASRISFAVTALSSFEEKGSGLFDETARTFCPRSQNLRSRALEQRRRSLSAPDAHRDDTVADLATRHFARDRTNEARAG